MIKKNIIHALLLTAIINTTAFADIMVMAVSGSKVIISIDGGLPKGITIGQSLPGNIKLISIADKGATFEIGGKKQFVPIGGHPATTNSTSSDSQTDNTGNKKVILQAKEGGHFFTDARINENMSVPFLVDTGATTIAIPMGYAKSLGLSADPENAVMVNTANGTARAYKVRLKSVRVGTILIKNVEGMLVENLNGPGLLGMSFLNKVKMQREANLLTLSQ